jgi:hypothetical protein
MKGWVSPPYLGDITAEEALAVRRRAGGVRCTPEHPQPVHRAERTVHRVIDQLWLHLQKQKPDSQNPLETFKARLQIKQGIW